MRIRILRALQVLGPKRLKASLSVKAKERTRAAAMAHNLLEDECQKAVGTSAAVAASIVAEVSHVYIQRDIFAPLVRKPPLRSSEQEYMAQTETEIATAK